MLPPDTNLTQVLQAAREGDRHATDQILTAVYDELRRLAASQIAREGPGLTLQPTALVHEAYLRLIGGGRDAGTATEWRNRAHFFAAAANAMRRILIERARKYRTAKHGGAHPLRRVSPDDAGISIEHQSESLLALDEAMAELERRDERKTRIVMLRFFAGLTIEQTAAAMDLSITTVKDEWSFARAWLQTELNRRGDAPQHIP